MCVAGLKALAEEVLGAAGAAELHASFLRWRLPGLLLNAMAALAPPLESSEVEVEASGPLSAAGPHAPPLAEVGAPGPASSGPDACLGRQATLHG